MPVYKIRGIDVDFPFDAYDCQLVYMDKVIQSLQEGRNALLESPTGTGKTLCLLCATLAWRRSFGEFLRGGGSEERNWGFGSQPSGSQQSGDTPLSEFPVIIYASRTHSQLKQVIRELKASNYRPKMAVLGSREQMCIHDEVRGYRGKAQNNACHFLCRKRLCRHQTLVPEYLRKNSELRNEPFDIEDLVNIGRTNGPCPYYISRELSKVVDILFAPYNYLIDPGNRKSLTSIPWSNAVLIFDEAHNVESVCAEAASFDLPSSYLTSCIAEAKQCIDICTAKRAIEKSADKQFDPDNYAILRALLLKLEKRINEVVIESKELGFTRPGNYVYDFLSDLNITYETSKMLTDTIDNASLLLEEGSAAETAAPVKTKGTVCRLETIRDILDIIFRGGGKTHAKYYRFHVEESQQRFGDSLKGKGSRTLSWWCFNPGLAMEEFIKLGVRSIILTSGTLSPLDSFAMELNLEFPVRLENPHVISSNQIWVGVIPTGPSGYPLNSSYRTRDSLEYKQELGNAIVNFARIVPDGLLVFFPSYYMMDKCIECWKSMSHSSSVDFSTIWERICKYKQPVVEPKQSSLFPHAIEDYETKLRGTSTSGAVFFAVCRGKVSEGLDFADRAGRAVLITGMPFAMKTDSKVRLKREYLDKQATSLNKSTKALTGDEWYVQQAARAVNQAIGRVIRHRHDYGAIIFCDERFAQQNHQCQMSYWLQPHIKCYSKFGDVVFTLTRFFRDKNHFDSLKRKQVEHIDNIATAEDKKSSLKPLTNLASRAENHSRRFLLSQDATTSSSNYSQLAHIVPANRSTLRTKQSYSSILPLSDSGDLLYWDVEAVDLTLKAPNRELLPEHSVSPLPIKKPKIMGRTKFAVDCGDVASSKLLDHVDSQALVEKCSSHRSRERHDERAIHLSAGHSAKFRNNDRVAQTEHPAEKGTVQQICQKNGDTRENSLPSGSQEKGASAFLKQVQEKLGVAEYQEFIEFMKAIKSKTMNIRDALKEIVKLFSFPGRLSLLERFGEFVPTKHVPIYEQLVRTHGAEADV